MSAESATAALLRGWSEGWERMARAQTRMMEALGEDADAVEAEALWTALESQCALWKAQARRAANGAASEAGADTLARFLDPAQWLIAGAEDIDPAARRLIERPSPSTLGEFGRAALIRTREWAVFEKAARAHRALIAKSWGRVAEQAGRAGARDPALSLDAAQGLVLGAVERELDALHASPTFTASLRATVVAALALRETEAAMVEAYCEARALPTRSEVDDLHRAVAELRRDLRALRRETGGDAAPTMKAP